MAKELELIKKIYTKAINDKSPGATTTTNILIRDINSTLVGNHTFFYELLQNMHDVASENDGTVYIRLSGNNLLISHNGRHFDEENINSLCSYSASGTNSKAAEGNTTGYKDVGFKTVFGVANTVYVFSKAYKFKFDKQFFEKQTFSYPWQIIPIPVEDNEAKIFNYPDELVSVILICKNPQEIIARLNELVADPSWFLFLPRIRSIQFDVNGQKLLLDREENTKENTVCFYQNKTLYDKYVFMSYTENIPLDVFQQLQSAGDDVVPTKLKRETKTKITFAARTINDKLVTQKQGKLYCLLPIQHTTGLPFSINAPFLLSTNRNEILNSFWNRYLISFITRHYFKWLNALAMSNKLYADSILQMVDSEIPNKLLRFTQQLGTQVITEQSHAIKVRSEWGEGLEREPFIRGRNNEYLTILQATVDKTGFYHQLLTLPSPQNTVIVASEVEQQQSLLIFGNRQIDWEELITYLQG